MLNILMEFCVYLARQSHHVSAPVIHFPSESTQAMYLLQYTG